MNEYYNLPPTPGHTLNMTVSQVMKRVYLKMFFGLLATAGAAWAIFSMGLYQILLTNKLIYFGAVIVELGLVLAITAGVRKMSSSTATILFYLFSLVNGVTLSLIFVAYNLPSIGKTFLITAGVFGAMSVYGYTTGKDLTKFGTFLIMALFGLIIASVVNIFTQSDGLSWIISFVGVLIFIGLTAYDTQTIKNWAQQMPQSSYGHIATIGALSLYLDFINLFLMLLRFFGSSRD